VAGSIQRRPDGKWRARYRDANHFEHARHFARKRDAERWLASQEVAIARGEWVDPTLSKITVGEWLLQWLAHQVQLKPTTMVRYEVALRRQILPRWEFVPLAKITHSDVSSWVHSLTDEGLAPATVRYAHRVLSLALTAAVRDGRLVKNVAEGVPLPRVVGKPKRFLIHDQVQTLAEACAPYGPLIKVLAYAGLRWGEVVALTTRRVDLKRRRIEVVEAITEVHGRVIVGTTKNHQRRSVPIPRFLADELAAQLAGKRPATWSSPHPKAACCGTPTSDHGSSTLPPRKRGWLDSPRMNCVTPRPARCGRRRQRQGDTADARARLGGHDPRRLRGSLCGRSRRCCGRSRRCCGPARPRLHETQCGPNADSKGPKPAQSRRAALREFVRTGRWLGHTGSEPPIGIEPMTYALRVASVSSIKCSPNAAAAMDVWRRP
jgi:integrase